MGHAACIVPAAPVYRGAFFETEMVNQLLFGESVHVLASEAGFWQIEGVADGYPGWVNSLQFTSISEEEATETPNRVTDIPLSELTTGAGIMRIPFGSLLRGFNNGQGRFGAFTYYYSGTPVHRTLGPCLPGDLPRLIDSWRQAPYCWGGRTLMGVDCSGFTQLLFRLLGVELYRDAYQQAGQGETVDFLAQARLGDLAFFDNEEGRVIHVGVLLTDKTIVHASGMVRQDRIDHAGIINAETGRRTHRLRIIKRHF